jgi:hypothetical protein
MTIDIKHLEDLIADKRYNEAKALIKMAMNEPLTKEQRGAALVDFASMYMKINTAIAMEHKSVLADAIEGMKRIRSAKSKVGDDIKLAEVRGKLA